MPEKALPIEKIKSEYFSLLSKFQTEDPETLTITEYNKFKHEYITEESSYKELFEELEITIQVKEKISKDKLVKELSNIFIKSNEIQKNLFSVASKKELELIKLKKEKRQIGENLNKRGISEDSQLIINILALDLLNSSSNSSHFKIKFMFENNIVQSEPIKSDHFVKQTIIYKVKDPNSLLHVQLINLGVLGRTKYPIKRLKNQKKKKIKLKIKNDSNRNVADLIVSIRWIFSIKELYSQRINFLKMNLDNENNKLKIINNKMTNLVKMAPNLNRFISFNSFFYKDNENFSLAATKKNLGNYFLPIILLLIFLCITNLFLTLSNPHLAELMFLLIFIAFIYYDNLQQYKFFIICTFSVFCVKDLLYFFFFLYNDHAQMIQELNFARSIVRVNQFVFPVNFFLKVVLNVLFFLSFQ